MCICVCICANNMQILGFGGVGGVRSGGGYHWGGRGGVWGSGDRAHIYIHTYAYAHACLSCLHVQSIPIANRNTCSYYSMCMDFVKQS